MLKVPLGCNVPFKPTKGGETGMSALLPQISISVSKVHVIIPGSVCHIPRLLHFSSTARPWTTDLVFFPRIKMKTRSKTQSGLFFYIQAFLSIVTQASFTSAMHFERFHNFHFRWSSFDEPSPGLKRRCKMVQMTNREQSIGMGI